MAGLLEKIDGSGLKILTTPEKVSKNEPCISLLHGLKDFLKIEKENCNLKLLIEDLTLFFKEVDLPLLLELIFSNLVVRERSVYKVSKSGKIGLH